MITGATEAAGGAPRGQPSGNIFRRNPVSKYRSLLTRAWGYFAPLSPNAAKLLLYLWAGPHSTQYGIIRLSEAYALADLRWNRRTLAATWAELEKADLVWRDGELLVIVPFLESNAPANENVLKGWRKALADLPDSPLYAKLREHAAEWLKPEGLVWLDDKAPSKPFENRSETVRELREQYSGSSDQGAGSRHREQGAGVVSEGERGEPGALRSASPRDAAPLRAPVPGIPSEGRTRTASKGEASERMRRLRDLLASDGSKEDKALLASRAGYTHEELQAAEKALKDRP